MDEDANTTPLEIYYKKFTIKGNSSVYAKVTWKENENDIFQIKIYEDDISWSGRFSREFGKQFSENIDRDEEDYYKNLKISLTEDCSEYIYDFAKSTTDSAQFVWKLKIGLTDTMVHGTVPVHKDKPPENTLSLLDCLITQNSSLKKDLMELQTSNKYMGDELEKYKTEFKEFINTKANLEKTMYGRFVNLLNTKKRRISVLEESLKRISNQSDVD